MRRLSALVKVRRTARATASESLTGGFGCGPDPGASDMRYAIVIEKAEGNPGIMEVTVSLKPVLCGTELSISQAGIPEAIPLEMCYLGWQESLAQLASLVEPEIPG